jgi:hypothetical protein
MSRNDYGQRFGEAKQYFGNFPDGRTALKKGGHKIMRKKFENGGKVCFDVDNPKIKDVLPDNLKNPRKTAAKGGRIEYSKGTMPKRNKKNFRSTKSGAGMTRAGVAAYRRLNPGSKLKTAVTGKVKPGSKAAKRRKSFCARSLGQMKKFPKAAKDPNSRLRQARRRWKC